MKKLCLTTRSNASAAGPAVASAAAVAALPRNSVGSVRTTVEVVAVAEAPASVAIGPTVSAAVDQWMWRGSP